MTTTLSRTLYSPLLEKVYQDSEGIYRGVDGDQEWASEIRRLAKERDAVLLAHNYEMPEIQDVSDHTGDSLALSRVAADDEHSTIVFCGVHFMAETAKILAPEKTVLLPDAAAGCSLADSITAKQLAEWKAQYPDAVVVSYVNTTAEVKALTDICCTSSNAVDVVRSIPEDQEILFCPDQNLGAHVQRMTGRTNMRIWKGCCHVHADITSEMLINAAHERPDADLYIHPECGGTSTAIDLVNQGVLKKEQIKVLSTGGMLEEAEAAAAQGDRRDVLVATEVGMLHQLRQTDTKRSFVPINDNASCPYMKRVTPAALLHCLCQGADEIHLPAEQIEAAYKSVDRMIAIGQTPDTR